MERSYNYDPLGEQIDMILDTRQFEVALSQCERLIASQPREADRLVGRAGLNL